MTLKKILSSLILFAGTSLAQTPGFDWARQFGGTLGQTPVAIGLDGSGNVYTCGFFLGTVDFDPGPGSFTLTAPGVKAMYVSKLDGQGNFIWARQVNGDVNLGQVDQTHAGAMAVSTAGEVFLTGFFRGVVDCDPGPGTYSLVSTAAGSSTFYMKLDAQGNFVWAGMNEGSQSDAGNAIALDPSGNVYITGYFSDVVDFDPGAGTFSLVSVNGAINTYVTKLNGNGGFLWTTQVSSPVGSSGNGIAIDPSGNVIVAGVFRGVTDFDGGPATLSLSSAGDQDAFIMKLDASGGLVWAKSVGGASDDGGIAAVIDATGNVYISGFFTGSADLDPGAGTSSVVSVGSNDVFLLKLDTQGNFVWQNAFGGSGNDVASGIAIGPDNALYATGYISGLVDFDPSASTLTISAMMRDVFVAKWSQQGGIQWAISLPGTGMSSGSDIIVDAATNIFSTGYFENTLDFDHGSATFTMTSINETDAYVHKMNCGSAPVIEVSSSHSVICAGESVSLYASGVQSYSWNAVASTGTIEASPLTTSEYTVTAEDRFGCKASASITQTVVDCTVLFDHEAAEEFLIYPNPASTYLSLGGKAFYGSSVLSVTNMLGETMITRPLQNSGAGIDVSALQPGAYILTVRDEAGAKTRMFIIER